MADAWQQEPQVGQKFWKEEVGSGVITAVDWEFKTVYVNFYEKGTDNFEFDEIFGNWSDELGGTWMIYNL